MSDDEDLAALEQAMIAAAARDDFEEAARLRNRLFVARAGGEATGADGDFAGLQRQTPGAMGIGSQHPRVAPPPGWTPPPKPSPMTRGVNRRGGRS